MTDAVWPDGAREAVQRASETAMVRYFNAQRDGYDSWADAILAALEPFVQQRIAAEVARLSTELREYQQVLRDHDNTATPGVLRGLLDQFKAVRAEVARLREDREVVDREVQVLRKCRTALDLWLSEKFVAARSAPGGEG